jgi:hypothetical protein
MNFKERTQKIKTDFEALITTQENIYQIKIREKSINN